MEEGKNTTTTTTTTSFNNNATVTQQHQQHLQQLYLLRQYQKQQEAIQQQQQSQQQQQQSPQQQQQSSQQQQQQHPHNNPQQQQAISRFPSNIDAHLRSPGLRSLHLTNNPQSQQQQQQQQQQQINASHASLQQAIAAHHQHPAQQQQMKAAAVMRSAHPPPVEVEMALQDAFKVCNPEIKRPFASLEDSVHRLLPYHVVSDFEAEEDDRILDSDATGQLPSRLQQWDHNILAKIAEFTTTFEKQVLAFNIMSRKRAQGEFRSEERLMIEQALIQEEKHAILEVRAEIECREKAAREAAEANMRTAMAQAEHTRAEAQAQAQAHAGMLARQPMRSSALGSHADDGSGQGMVNEQGGNQEEVIHGWGNAQREEDPSEDFLNDDNEPENGETELQEEWREVGEFDLNTR